MNIVIPEKVKNAMKQLNDKGFESFIVGGCVRDSVLGRTPKDWDIATNATPEQVQLIFNNTIPTGIEHGTITVRIDGENFEVTTYRIDGEYLDARHPEKVIFTDDIRDDLSRRDFTINAMAYNEKNGIVDPFDGLKDLEDKVIRCVGNADDRIKEDALRMLRAIRFQCQLDGFEIDSKTFEAIVMNAELIEMISAERVRDELNKILMTGVPSSGFSTMRRLGLLQYIIPELDQSFQVTQNTPYHFANVGEHTLLALSEINLDHNDLVLNLAALFHDIGKIETKTTQDGIDHFYGHQQKSYDMTIRILTRMRYDNHTIQNVSDLVLHHMDEIPPSRRAVKRAMNRLGVSTLKNVLQLKIADITAQSNVYFLERLENIRKVFDIMEEILAEKEVFSLKDLAINGYDLITIGYKSGKKLGNALNVLLSVVIDYPELNKREYLLSMAEGMLEDAL